MSRFNHEKRRHVQEFDEALDRCDLIGILVLVVRMKRGFDVVFLRIWNQTRRSLHASLIGAENAHTQGIYLLKD